VSNGGALSATALSKYSKTDAFYVTRDDFIATSESLFPHPGILDRESSSGLFIDNSMAVMNEIQDSLGLNENLLELSSNLAGDIGQFFKNSSIEDMLSSFKRSKDRYVYDHSLLTSVFASAMASGAEWSNPKNIEKLVLASLVHDLGFTHPRLALVELNHKTSLNLSKEQKTEILNHPAKMAKLLSVSGTVPSEVINIVAKHHEMEELGNYPLGLNARGFSILECVFIIAHQFSNELYRVSFRVDKISVAIERVLQFPDTGNFKQAKQLFVSAIAKKYHFKQSI
jgi:HD-GYP domain-containing protein (c-di-GMP phosphodiesterase class II)